MQWFAFDCASFLCSPDVSRYAEFKCVVLEYKVNTLSQEGEEG